MNLVNKTSTITVTVVAALVALAITAHVSGALRLSPVHAAIHGTEQGTAPGNAARPGSLASRSGTGQGAAAGQPDAGQGSGSAGGASSAGSSAGGSGAGHAGVTSSSGSSSGGSSSGGHSILPHLLMPYFPHTPLTIVTSIPSPTGTIGDPGVPCLQGYVWRKAYAGDYVCVTPANRAQAGADNAAALSRVAPGGGAYGQYTCQQGYVWRQVVPDDYVCVTPAVRAQAAYDNSQANNRVALFSLWMSDWTPPSQSGQNCSGDVCTTTDGGWDGPDFQINGDHFNFGPVLLEIRSNGGAVLWSQTVTATSYPGFPGGALYAQTPIGDCSRDPGTTDNDYVIAYDTVSGRWSNELPIDSDCASF
jgi:hypothetical protein